MAVDVPARIDADGDVQIDVLACSGHAGDLRPHVAVREERRAHGSGSVQAVEHASQRRLVAGVDLDGLTEMNRDVAERVAISTRSRLAGQPVQGLAEHRARGRHVAIVAARPELFGEDGLGGQRVLHESRLGEPERVAVGLVKHAEGLKEKRDVFERRAEPRLAVDAVTVHAAGTGVQREQPLHGRGRRLEVTFLAEELARAREGLDHQRVPARDGLGVDERPRAPLAQGAQRVRQ